MFSHKVMEIRFSSLTNQLTCSKDSLVAFCPVAFCPGFHGYGSSPLSGPPVYAPAFAGIHCAQPQKNGQAEMTCLRPAMLPLNQVVNYSASIKQLN